MYVWNYGWMHFRYAVFQQWAGQIQTCVAAWGQAFTFIYVSRTKNCKCFCSVTKLPYFVLYYSVMFGRLSPTPVKTGRAVQVQQTNQVKVDLLSIKQSIDQKGYTWLIDFAHFRENCPTGIIPQSVQKVTQHNGIIQYFMTHRDSETLINLGCI